MSDLISRQQVLKTFEEMQWYSVRNGKLLNGALMKDALYKATDVYKVLKEVPSAEPQIIRCKDCKHWIPYDWMFREIWQSKNIADYPEDDIGCDCCDMAMKANDFCSRAERRENEP